jgi:DNA-binding GntR family transcriptional regulator
MQGFATPDMDAKHAFNEGRMGMGSLMATLAEQIEELIISGELPAGAKLDEQILAHRFDVSRTPVREALRQLASTGLIELRPNRGAFVATISADQLREMFIAMAEVEATCARLAAISMTPAERQNFQRLHDRMGEMIERDKVRDFGEMNEAFHIMIYRGAHNRYLEDIAGGLRRRLSLYRRSQFRTAGRLARSHAEHEVVVKAIISGDPARAHATMLHHVDRVEASVEKMLADMKD